MKIAETAEPFVPVTDSLRTLAAAADKCRGCELYRNATQAVFGEGPKNARLMLVGEVPGDDEDIAGRPFVGPAGKLLDRALADAGLDRLKLYLTNAVKHFNFMRVRNMRMHKTPKPAHIAACRPWLEAEVETIKPKLIVTMGATALRSVMAKAVTIKSMRGKIHESPFGRLLATVHPSAILRMPEAEDRHAEYERFVADLRLAAKDR
jgi:uracil-DNA glycosylase